MDVAAVPQLLAVRVLQTKYDFNVGGNGTFRLFPTGTNRYPKGTEVFNSYGRRDNRHLLMEYGFAIENNEWETFLLHVRPRGGCSSRCAPSVLIPAPAAPCRWVCSCRG